MNKKIIKTKLISFMIFIIIISTITGCSINDNSDDNNNNKNNQINNDPNKITIVFFWGDGCPHCEEQKPFLEELEKKYPDKIEIKMFETWKNPENAKLFQETAKKYDTTARGVPVTFIQDEYWVGYSKNIANEIENKIKYCIENTCVDKLN
ncbi:MAG: thioredoxin family protein [Nanoarchaeota archaeon]